MFIYKFEKISLRYLIQFNIKMFANSLKSIVERKDFQDQRF